MRGRPKRDSGRVDEAVRRARAVVGLYGDPDITWSFVLELDFGHGLAALDVEARLRSVVAQYAHLGRQPVLVRFTSTRRRALVEEFANLGYADESPLIRCALSEDGRTLVLACHHGVADGLGMIGLAGEVIGRPLGTGAKGVQRTGGERGFLLGSLSRLGEVLFRPPSRFEGGGRRPGQSGDWLVMGQLDDVRVSTASLAWAASKVLAAQEGRRNRWRQPVIALGVSRRPGRPPIPPDRDTGYVRLHTRATPTVEAVRRQLQETRPEPDFPAREGTILPRITRLFADRLGASVLVSNIGRVTGCDDLVAFRQWSVASGPAGVGVGLATVGPTTCLTIRTRRDWFTREATVSLLDALTTELQHAAVTEVT